MTSQDLVKKRTISKVRLNKAPSVKGLEVIEEENREDKYTNQN